MVFFMYFDSPLGPILLTEEEGALTGIRMEGQRRYGCLPEGAQQRKTPLLQRAADWLCRYFSGEHPSPQELPLAAEGTAFQKRVWALLRDIPYGETATYGDLARRLAKEQGGNMSAQAVGQAAGRNPLSIVVPCHRVLGADRALTGYNGGTEKKRWLLQHEGCL